MLAFAFTSRARLGAGNFLPETFILPPLPNNGHGFMTDAIVQSYGWDACELYSGSEIWGLCNAVIITTITLFPASAGFLVKKRSKLFSQTISPFNKTITCTEMAIEWRDKIASIKLPRRSAEICKFVSEYFIFHTLFSLEDSQTKMDRFDWMSDSNR